MSAEAERVLVTGRLLAVERVLVSVRAVVERSGFEVLDELVVPRPGRLEFDARVEFAAPGDPRVEVLRVRSDAPETARLHTVSAFTGVPLTDPTAYLLADVPWPPAPRPVPSNEDYRRLVEHRELGEALPDDLRRDLEGLDRDAFDVARERAEAPVEVVRLAIALLDAVASGAPPEWALRHVRGRGR